MPKTSLWAVQSRNFPTQKDLPLSLSVQWWISSLSLLSITVSLEKKLLKTYNYLLICCKIQVTSHFTFFFFFSSQNNCEFRRSRFFLGRCLILRSGVFTSLFDLRALQSSGTECYSFCLLFFFLNFFDALCGYVRGGSWFWMKAWKF